MAENMAALAELNEMLATQGKPLANFPLVLECNKSDLPRALPAPEIATSLQLEESMAVRASALHGEGVFDGLRAISKQVVGRL
jgi:signal recognition particle receptor subunit beta